MQAAGVCSKRSGCSPWRSRSGSRFSGSASPGPFRRAIPLRRPRAVRRSCRDAADRPIVEGRLPRLALFGVGAVCGDGHRPNRWPGSWASVATAARPFQRRAQPGVSPRCRRAGGDGHGRAPICRMSGSITAPSRSCTPCGSWRSGASDPLLVGGRADRLRRRRRRGCSSAGGGGSPCAGRPVSPCC